MRYILIRYDYSHQKYPTPVKYSTFHASLFLVLSVLQFYRRVFAEELKMSQVLIKIGAASEFRDTVGLDSNTS